MIKELQNAIRHIKTRSDAWAVKVIEDALEQEPCNDAINREEAIDQLDQSINILEATDRIKALPSVQPNLSENPTSCEDVISLDHAKKLYCYEICTVGVNCKDMPTLSCNILKKFDDLPSVQPSRKTAKQLLAEFVIYQTEWLCSHNDLELDEDLEKWVVQFLHDTRECFTREI